MTHKMTHVHIYLQELLSLPFPETIVLFWKFLFSNTFHQKLRSSVMQAFTERCFQTDLRFCSLISIQTINKANIV